MQELRAWLSHLWIEHGEKAAVVLLLVTIAVVAVRALAKGGKGNA